jgi:hypothetical protein
VGTLEFVTLSHAITGDLGQRFSNTKLRSPIQPTARELPMNGTPRGTLLPAENRQLNFGFYREPIYYAKRR